MRNVLAHKDKKPLKLYLSKDLNIKDSSHETIESESDLQRHMNSLKTNRNRFHENLSEKEILGMLRDISAFICARDLNPSIESWVSSQKSLICTLSLMRMTFCFLFFVFPFFVYETYLELWICFLFSF